MKGAKKEREKGFRVPHQDFNFFLLIFLPPHFFPLFSFFPVIFYSIAHDRQATACLNNARVVVFLSIDPFSVHFERDLEEDEVQELKKVYSKPLEYQHSIVWSYIDYVLKLSD